MTTSSSKAPAKKTTTKRSRTSKTTAPKKTKSSTTKAATTTKAKAGAPAKPKAAPAAQSVKPSVVNAPEAVVVGPSLRKKELIDAVVQRTGLKKRDVRPVVESMLGVVGEALAEGRELVAQPLGKLKVHKKKTTSSKRILFAKVHQNLPPDPSSASTDDTPKE